MFQTTRASALLVALGGHALVYAQASEPEIELTSTELAPGMHVLQSANDEFVGGNMALLTGDDGVILIDDGIKIIAPALLDAIAEITGEPVDYLVNTHYHGDHTGTNAEMGALGATIIAHNNIRTRLQSATGDDAMPAEGLPIITFEDGVSLHLNGIALHAIHMPAAHTDGDSIIYFPDANVIHTGDVLFNGLFPYVDLDGGGTVDGYLAAQEKVIALANDDTTIISGHGPLATRADIIRARDVLADSRARVQRLIDAGNSEAEIVNANPLADYHDDWNWGFITTEVMTRTLVKDLTR